MQLLVSVRSASEVEPALAGGADIIDAKEPARGSLGPVSPQTLAEILLCLPPDQPLSVALGDVSSEGGLFAAINGLALPSRGGPTFLKLGFAGVASPEVIGSLLARAVRLAAVRPQPPLIIAVAYADFARAGTVSPELVSPLAQRAGAAGVLVDTCIKDGLSLLDWLTPAALKTWVLTARQGGLLSAVAGALRPGGLDAVKAATPDVVGFRGAACEGGRSGLVSAARVARLRRQIGRPDNEVSGALRPMASGASQNA